MKLNSRKIFGFIVTEFILIGIFATILITIPSLLEALGKLLISTILINYIILIGGNSLDKFVISKNFVKELHEGE